MQTHFFSPPVTELSQIIAGLNGREPTAEERSRIDTLRRAAQRYSEVEADRAAFAEFTGPSDGRRLTSGQSVSRGEGLPQAILASAFGEYLREHKGRLRLTGSAWTTPPLDLAGFGGGNPLQAATITEDPAADGLVPPTQYLPGVQPLGTRPLVVRDLLGAGVATSNTVTFNRETAITNAAAGVLEGAAKPESAILFEAVTEGVNKIATWLPVTEEIVEDFVGFIGYLTTRLQKFVLLTEDDALLNGDGVAPNFLGLLHRPGLAAPVVRVDPENNADAILRQISAIETSTSETVTGIIMNPADWNTLLLLKNTLGDYVFGGGPFNLLQQPSLWGKAVALSPVIAQGTALLGALKTTCEFRLRTPVRITTSNSHQDYFIRNKVAVLAEERGALVVYREQAIGAVTNLTGTAAVAPGRTGGKGTK